MDDDDVRITRREFERAALAVLGTAALAGCHEYRPACARDALHDDPLDGYEPRILTKEQCITLAATAEVMIGPCAPVISPIEVARRADYLLAATGTPSADEMKKAIDAVEAFAGLFSFDFRDFSDLDLDTRREVIAKFVRHHGIERDVTRVLKMLTVVPYYSHPDVRRSIGFVEYEQRPRVKNALPLAETTRKSFPEPAHFGPDRGEAS